MGGAMSIPGLPEKGDTCYVTKGPKRGQKCTIDDVDFTPKPGSSMRKDFTFKVTFSDGTNGSFQLDDLHHSPLPSDDDDDDDETTSTYDRITIKGAKGMLKTVNGTYKRESKTRNGAPCYTGVSGSGAIYFDNDDGHWRLTPKGTGPDADGWVFSQRGKPSAPPLGKWIRAKATWEKPIDYTLRLYGHQNDDDAKIDDDEEEEEEEEKDEDKFPLPIHIASQMKDAPVPAKGDTCFPNVGARKDQEGIIVDIGYIKPSKRNGTFTNDVLFKVRFKSDQGEECYQAPELSHSPSLHDDDDDDATTVKTYDKIKVTGAKGRKGINGTYKKDTKTRNGAPCYTHVSGNCGIYFDDSHWKISPGGTGPGASGWAFSQRGKPSGPPCGVWTKQKAFWEPKTKKHTYGLKLVGRTDDDDDDDNDDVMHLFDDAVVSSTLKVGCSVRVCGDLDKVKEVQGNGFGGFTSSMENYIGKVGKVTIVDSSDGTCKVKFPDGEDWWFAQKLMTPIACSDSGTKTTDEDDDDAFYTGKDGVWQWQDDGGDWSLYAKSDSALVEKAYQKDKGVARLPEGYAVHTGKKMQANPETEKVRMVRRIKKPDDYDIDDDDDSGAVSAEGTALGATVTVEDLSGESSDKQSLIMNQLAMQMVDMCMNEVPKGWVNMKRGTVSKRVNLPTGSKEYKEVARHFGKTMDAKRIKTIHRIQNKVLWQRYISEKISLIGNNKGAHNQRMLFHGTGKCKPGKIYKGRTGSGFDPRIGSGFYGTGAYFAEKASYSDDGFVHQTKNGERQLFLAMVLTGKSKDFGTNTETDLKRPPVLPSGGGIYDSVKGGPHSGSLMYVVYDTAKSYPAYLITYK